MDWVETTGRTISEATTEALNQLSVSEEDAEIVVLSEPKPGLFGRVRSEARVRARVRPVGSTRQGTSRERGREPRSGPLAPMTPSVAPPVAMSEKHDPGRDAMAGATREGREHESPATEVPLAEQAEVARAFLVGLLERIGLPASVGVSAVSEGVTELRVTGNDLALLVGPRGSTVDALQDLVRVVVQRRTGALQGRLFVDVAGYRQKRRQALEVFARQRAEEVLNDGLEQALEPMTPADRKVVHATLNAIEGVSTHSEGEEPHRRVVISRSN